MMHHLNLMCIVQVSSMSGGEQLEQPQPGQLQMSYQDLEVHELRQELAEIRDKILLCGDDAQRKEMLQTQRNILLVELGILELKSEILKLKSEILQVEDPAQKGRKEEQLTEAQKQLTEAQKQLTEEKKQLTEEKKQLTILMTNNSTTGPPHLVLISITK
jgi:hypothetical protein